MHQARWVHGTMYGLKDQVENPEHNQQADQENNAHYPTNDLDHTFLRRLSYHKTSEVRLQFPISVHKHFIAEVLLNPCSHVKAVLAPLAVALQNPAPWLWPYLSLLRQILEVAESHSVVAALNAARGDIELVSFVDHSELPTSEAYEAFIARTACVPTRDNLHDLFNGLMWLIYPQTKRRLNRLQANQITLRGTSGPRGPLRDALTLFDENAAVLQAPTELVDALRVRDWNTLFITLRSQWQSARFVVFGHALLEKLMQPRKAITAHVWVVDELSDVELASSLTAERLAAKMFVPLPVLGVPGWWSANEQPGFYDDADVFRHPR